MITSLQRKHLQNHKIAFYEMLQEIEFIDLEKAKRITREIEDQFPEYQDLSFIFVKDKRIVAMLLSKKVEDFSEVGKTVELKYLSVRSIVQKKGIASELLDFLFSYAKRNFSNIILSCYDKNEAALKFYSKHYFFPYKVNSLPQTRIIGAGTDQEHRDVILIRKFPLHNLHVRLLRTSNIDFLKDMTFYSLYKGSSLFEREILEKKEIKKYYADWDSKREIGYIARYLEQDIGAIWCRLFPYYDQGFGYVDDAIPEMSIAVLPRYRGRGVGHILMENLFNRLRHANIKGISTYVEHGNPARIAYQRLGFVGVRREKKYVVLVKDLRQGV